MNFELLKDVPGFGKVGDVFDNEGITRAFVTENTLKSTILIVDFDNTEYFKPVKWVPKHGEKYWTISQYSKTGTLYIRNIDGYQDRIAIDRGFAWQTESEAAACFAKMMEVVKK